MSQVQSDDDRIFATAIGQLENPEFTYRPAVDVDDVVAISFNGDHWSTVGTTSTWMTTSNDENEGHITLYSGSLGGGLAALADLPRKDGHVDAALPDTATVQIQTEIQNLDGVSGNILGSYVHTRSGSIESISAGVGGVEMTLDGWTSTQWDLAESADPDPLL